ncbi:trypsin-like peptidase domain-containing protein [Phycicoccus sp. MAQZ13P-2]|uniref:S1C family serine protease n=1 Tax=Phycicoccus mangrovi TaxID=2840470 RepID=UPI001C006B78|nr:trypsin-like peptidase domain-containing protein [Phycicoccus mangrovi]MBT9254027.1 trypsin-like peptidase domain-containing protein [Phycicoccus mangrovi]MBT9275560.1 trypsin-like peptidase domain-containing protein [Phycicoccus mangrovi]
MSERDRGSDDWQPWDREPPSGPATEPVPAAEPQWAGAAGAEPTTELPAGPPPPPYQPISGSWGAPPVPPAASSAHPVSQPEPRPGRRGPGWGALVGVALATALVAGTTGGIVGGALADRGSGSSGGTSVAAPQPGAGATTRPRGSVANIAATALPSVVTLRVEGADGGATGSGWVYDDRGHVVTNNHVVAGAGDSTITVVLSNGKQVSGKVVGRDASYDLAVVRVEGADLAPLPVGSSSDVVVGDEVIAVGAPLGLDSTVTSGIVSALDRPVTPGQQDDQSFINAIQTDAAINPGNSGGPLLDMQGRVIGVNSAIARVPGTSLGGQSGNIGVGFAIPSDQVSTTVDQLISTGKAEHPIIGVYLDSSYDGEGVRVAEDGPNGDPAVNPGGPADEAGIEAGDVITAFEGRPVSDDGELVVKIRARRVGESVRLTIVRDGRERDVTMVLQGSE